jgi:acyl-CoA synthetase (NDP forming)
VAVIATSGGAAIMAADQAEAYGVALPQPQAAAAAVLAERIPEFGSPRNPCDVTAQVLNDPDSLPACAHALLGDPAIGALVVPSVYATPTAVARISQYGEWARAHGKPVVNVWLAESLPPEMARAMEAEPSVPMMRSMATAFAAIAAWQRGAARRMHDAPHGAPAATKAAAARRLASAAGPVLSEREAKAVLKPYGIDVVEEALARDADDAATLAARLGYPVVLKVESPDLPHKSEAGVIRLDLRDEAAVRDAYAIIIARAEGAAARIDGVLVQRMVPAGLEMLIGGRIDPLFGPLVVVGMGGVLVELLGDRAVALAPLRHTEAVTMLRGLKGAALLDGFRGSAGVDIDRLAGMVCAAGAFLADHADAVSELDINPLICAGETVVAVDALIVLRRGAVIETA